MVDKELSHILNEFMAEIVEDKIQELRKEADAVGWFANPHILEKITRYEKLQTGFEEAKLSYE